MEDNKPKNEHDNIEKFEKIMDQLFDKDEQGNLIKAKDQKIGVMDKLNKQKIKLSKWYKKQTIKKEVQKIDHDLKREYFFGQYTAHLLVHLQKEGVIEVLKEDNFHEYIMKHIINYIPNEKSYLKAAETGGLNVDFNINFDIKDTYKKEE